MFTYFKKRLVKVFCRPMSFEISYFYNVFCLQKMHFHYIMFSFLWNVVMYMVIFWHCIRKYSPFGSGNCVSQRALVILQLLTMTELKLLTQRQYSTTRDTAETISVSYTGDPSCEIFICYSHVERNDLLERICVCDSFLQRIANDQFFKKIINGHEKWFH